MTADSVNIITNAACNIVVFISMLAFIIFCFGREDSTIYKYGSFQAYGLKFGLVTICLGSLSNVLTLSNPPFTEIILNIGLAALFLWAAIFHYFVFIVKKQPGKPVSKSQIKKANDKMAVGSTWVVSLIAQIVNAGLVGYLISLCFSCNFFNGHTVAIISISFSIIQSWSFYAIFKTLRIRSLSKTSKRKLK